MIETRKTEIRCKTSDPKRMLNRYIASRVLKTWKEGAFMKSVKSIPLSRNLRLSRSDALSHVNFRRHTNEI